MGINSLRDGFVSLCFDPSLNVSGEGCRVVVEGQHFGTATDDVLIRVTSTRDLNTLFGAGSVLATGLATALGSCGSGVEIFAVPRPDAVGSTAAVYTLTITNAATSDGRVDIYWGEARWNISVAVATGDTPAMVAAAIQAAVPADFPYAATVAAGVVTLTAKNAGTVGNFLNPQINWHGRNNYLPGATTITVAQTTVGAGDPAPLDYAAVLGGCCVCSFVMLYGNTAWQDGVLTYLGDAWSCDKPQCFGHGYTYNAGSLGTILATDTNSATLSRMAHCPEDPNFPWLKVANYGAVSACRTLDNPEISIQGPNLGVLEQVRHPEYCTHCWTFDEQNQLRDGGFVVTVPVSGGQGALTSPMVTNDITNNRYDSEGRLNLTFRDVSARRLAAKTAAVLAEELQAFNGLGYFSENTDIRAGVQGSNRKLILGQIRAWAKENVGVLFSEFDNLDKDLTLTDDFAAAPRCQGQPGKLYLNIVYRPPVRTTNIVVNAAPKLLDNC